MSEETNPVQEKVNDKELNFRAQEAKYEKMLAAERAARQEAEQKTQEALSKINVSDDDMGSDDLIDERKLNKKLSKFGQNTQTDIQRAMQQAKQAAKEELKQEMWLESNPDFVEVMQKHAESFATNNRHLADTILRMPESFERQKLVYQNIKALGMDKPAQKEPSVQEKIDANRKSPYYQPSGIANSPYSAAGNFSEQGQKEAYQQMQNLKKKLKI